MTTYAPETHRHRVHAPWLIAVAVLAAVLVALVAVGCGGGSKTLTKEEYGRQLNQICADLEAKEREIGEVNTIPEFVAKGPKLLDMNASAVAKAKELKPPAEIKDQAAKFVSLNEQALALISQLIDAAKANDQAAIQEIGAKIGPLGKEIDDIAKNQLGASACASPGAVRSGDPRAYLDHALAVIRDHAVYTPAGGWPAALAQARSIAGGATTIAETYAGILYLLNALHEAGDLHAALAAGGPLPGVVDTVLGTLPTVSQVTRTIVLVALPATVAAPLSEQARAYAAAALTGIRRAQASVKPCGWIVDLRSNGGGDMWPMLLSIGPLLGSGRIVGFRESDGTTAWVTYAHSTLAGNGLRVKAPVVVGDLKPRPPVAVLFGSGTASAGELVAISLRGRARSRSFGTTSAGAAAAARSFALSDGAVVRLATGWDVDRSGEVYKRALKPDVAVSDDYSGRRTIEAAVGWLGTVGCPAH